MVSSEIPFLLQFIHFPHIAGLQNECTRIKGEHWEEIRYPRSDTVVATICMICACFVLLCLYKARLTPVQLITEWAKPVCMKLQMQDFCHTQKMININLPHSLQIFKCLLKQN